MSDTGVEFEEDSFSQKQQNVARRYVRRESRSSFVRFLQKKGLGEKTAQGLLIGVALLFFLISFSMLFSRFVL